MKKKAISQNSYQTDLLDQMKRGSQKSACLGSKASSDKATSSSRRCIFFQPSISQPFNNWLVVAQNLVMKQKNLCDFSQYQSSCILKTNERANKEKVACLDGRDSSGKPTLCSIRHVFSLASNMQPINVKCQVHPFLETTEKIEMVDDLTCLLPCNEIKQRVRGDSETFVP